MENDSQTHCLEAVMVRQSAQVRVWGDLEHLLRLSKADFYRMTFQGDLTASRLRGPSLLYALQEVYLIVDLSVWTEEVPSSNALPTCGASVYLYTPSAYEQPPHHGCWSDGELGLSLWV